MFASEDITLASSPQWQNDQSTILLYLFESFPQEQDAADLLLLRRKQQECILSIYNKEALF